MPIICLDTGVLSIYFSKDVTKDVSELITKIKQKQIEAHVLKPVFVEVFWHLCRIHGIDAAKSILVSFLNLVPIEQVELTLPLIIKADLSFEDTVGEGRVSDAVNIISQVSRGTASIYPEYLFGRNPKSSDTVG